MSFYSELADDASEVLAELGQEGSVTRYEHISGGPSDTSGGSTSEATYIARMAVFPVSKSRVDGTNVKAGDYQCICEAIPIEITADDKVSCSFGNGMTIVELGKISPAGLTIAYDMVIRG